MPSANLFHCARELHRSGRLSEAETSYRALLAIDARHADANYNLGVLLVQLKRQHEALPLFKTALEVRPSERGFWMTYIKSLVNSGYFPEAKQVLEKGVGLGLSGQDVNEVAAVIAQSLTSVSVQNELVNQDESTQTIYARFWTLINTRQHDEAEELARNLIRDNKHAAKGAHLLGAALLVKTRYVEALEWLMRASQLLTDDGEVWNHLAVAMSCCGKKEDASIAFERALELTPDNPSCLANASKNALERGLFDVAAAYANRACTVQPDNVQALVHLGAALIGLGRPEDACIILRQAVAMKPDSYSAHNDLGNALYELGLHPDAIAHYRRALEIHNEHPQAHSNLGNALSAIDDIEAASASYMRALQCKSDYAPAIVGLALLLLKQDRILDADSMLRDAISQLAERREFDPVMVRVWLTMTGSCASLDGEVEARTAWLEQIGLAHERLTADVQVFRMIHLWRHGRMEELQQLVDGHSDFSKPRARDDRFMHAYFIYLRALAEVHSITESSKAETVKSRILYVLGDSHSLSPSGQPINWRGESFIGKSGLVIGVKFFHLGQKSPNRFKAQFADRILALPGQADVLITVGEIDCRQDEGLWMVAKKKSVGLDSLISTTIDHYLEWLESQFKHKELRTVIIQGVPAPAYQLSLAGGGAEEHEFLDMIHKVNLRLKAGVTARGWYFLDVYQATADCSGKATGKWHIDDYHLSPRFYHHFGEWVSTG